MKRRQFSKLLGGLAVMPAFGSTGAIGAPGRRWSFTAAVAECCSCAVPCPCNFGNPTDKACNGNRLIQITQGDFEGEDLAGIAFVVTFAMGNWTRLYIDAALGDPQAAALDKLLPVAFAGYNRAARAKERVPLTVTRTADMVRFSVPESRVEMKLVAGRGGNPIVITGLPSSALYDYVQYESVVHAHHSVDADWSYSGTNGFTSEMRASG